MLILLVIPGIYLVKLKYVSSAGKTTLLHGVFENWSDLVNLHGAVATAECSQVNGARGDSPGVLKELAGVTAGPLSTIYQRSWQSGEVPVDWEE